MENQQNLPQILPRISASSSWFEDGAKRLTDILASVIGLLLLSPFFALIAVAIKREGPGSVFYRGTRTGRDGKEFGILKFRTMHETPASYQGPRITARDDDRVTPLGRWLRDTKLNELPQLWNVLVGEMSLVGPRPEDPEIVKTWPEEARREILSVRPGITSPASIIYRDEEDLLTTKNVMDCYLQDVLPDKLRLDQLYVRNHNFLSDLDVIFYTLLALLPQLRRNSIPTEQLYNGILTRFSRRLFSWFMVDSFVAFTAVSLAVVLKRMNGPLDLGFDIAFGIAALMAITFSLVNTMLGLERIAWRYAKPSYVFDLALSSVVTTLLLVTVDWFWPHGQFFPPGTIIVAGLLAFLGFVGMRYRERLVTSLAARWLSLRGRADGMGERVLIVGAGECGLLTGWLLHHSQLSSAFSIVGMVDDDPAKHGLRIDGHYVFGLTQRIPDLVKAMDIGVILFAIERIQPAEQARILNLCRQTRARIILVPDLLAIFRERMTQGSLEVAQAE